MRKGAARLARESGLWWGAVTRVKGVAGVVVYCAGYQEPWMWRLPGQKAVPASSEVVSRITLIEHD
jgi:hypothetical protein